MENNQNNIGCGAIIFIFIIMMIILSQCSGKTESYYYDSNGNGRMDNGEHMYLSLIHILKVTKEELNKSKKF